MYFIKSERPDIYFLSRLHYSVYFDFHFIYDLWMDGTVSRPLFVYKVEKYEDAMDFVNQFKEFKPELITLEERYNEYLKKYIGLTPLFEGKEICGSNYSIILKPNEFTHHHVPHVHIELNDGSSSSVSIDDNFDFLAISGKAKLSDYKNAIIALKSNINKLRKDWNEKVSSNYKFIESNGIYYCS